MVIISAAMVTVLWTVLQSRDCCYGECCYRYAAMECPNKETVIVKNDISWI